MDFKTKIIFAHSIYLFNYQIRCESVFVKNIMFMDLFFIEVDQRDACQLNFVKQAILIV